jgi:hypothetical protein
MYIERKQGLGLDIRTSVRHSEGMPVGVLADRKG